MNSGKVIVWALVGFVVVAFIKAYWQVLIVLMGIMGLWHLFEKINRQH